MYEQDVDNTHTDADIAKNYMQQFNNAVRALNKDKGNGKKGSNTKPKQKYGLAHFHRDAPKIVRLFIPVLTCVLLVLFSVVYLDFYRVEFKSFEWKAYLPYDDLEVEASHGSSRSHKPHGSAFELPNTTSKPDILSHIWIIVCFIGGLFLFLILGTFILLVTYKSGHSRSITCISTIPYFIYLAIFPIIYIQELIYTLNVAMDWFSVALFLYNQTVVGLLVLFYAGPNWAKKIYYIIVGAMLAFLIIKFVNEWVEVGLMVLLICWDLFAMLHSNGKYIHICLFCH